MPIRSTSVGGRRTRCRRFSFRRSREPCCAASLAAFIGFFVIARLPRPWHPVFEIDGFERATIDRYWLAVDAADRRSAPDLTVRELSALSPLRLV